MSSPRPRSHMASAPPHPPNITFSAGMVSGVASCGVGSSTLAGEPESAPMRASLAAHHGATFLAARFPVARAPAA